VVLATKETRNAQRAATFVFLLILCTGARQVGHALEQGAAPGRRCRRRAATLRRRLRCRRMAFIVTGGRAENALAAATARCLPRLSRIGETAGVEQQFVFARALRAVVGLERQLQRIAIVGAIVEVIIVAVIAGNLGIAIIPGAVDRAVAVFPARSETAVVGRIGQSVIMPARIAGIVRLRGLSVGGPGCVAALRGIIVLEASRLREIGAGAGGFLAPVGSGRQRQDRLLGRTPHAESHRSGALRMIGALLY